MATLQINTVFDSNAITSDKGSTIPAWYSDDLNTFKANVSNLSNWWGGGEVDFFHSKNANRLFIQYGQDNTIYAAARFFSENLTLSNEVINNNGSITVDVSLEVGYLGGTKNSHSSAGIPVQTTISVLGQTIFTYSGNTIDTYFSDSKPVINKTITIQPQTNYGDLLFTYTAHYPSTGRTDVAKFGLTVYNPIPPVYRPNSVYNGTKWLDHQNHNGIIQVYNGSKWVDASTENTATEGALDSGKNRVYNNGWRQATRMNGDK